MSENSFHCHTCHEPFSSQLVIPQCPSCGAWWIDQPSRHYKRPRAVRAIVAAGISVFGYFAFIDRGREGWLDGLPWLIGSGMAVCTWAIRLAILDVRQVQLDILDAVVRMEASRRNHG